MSAPKLKWSVGDFVSLADPETFARAWVGTVTKVQPTIGRVVP